MRTSPSILVLAFALACGCVDSDDEPPEADHGSDSGGVGGKADELPEDGFACADPSFDAELIAKGNVGKYVTFRIDGQGRQHVFYRDEASDAMVYATRPGAGAPWAVETTPCSRVLDELYWSPVELTASQNMAVTHAGDVYLMCGGWVGHRPPGDAGWISLPVPFDLDGWGPDVFLGVLGSSIIADEQGTVHAVTTSERETLSGFLVAAEIDHFELTPTGWQTSRVANWRPYTGVRAHGTRIALCAGVEGPRVSFPMASQYGPLFTDARPGFEQAEQWEFRVMRDHGQVAQGSGYQPSCATDAEGRAIHVGYNYGYSGSYDALEIARQGDGEPIVKEIADGGRYPDVAIWRDKTFVSYQLDDALKLYVTSDSGIDHFFVSDTASHSSMAFDDAGRPHIAYYDHGDARLELAVGRCD